MTSRSRNSLASRQLAMLLRNKPRRLRKLPKKHRERVRRRIASVILVRQGWTAERLASHFKVSLSSVQIWLQRGCPIV